MPEPVLDGGTREIFARIVDGDRYAMNDFFTRYRGRVENLVAEMTGDFVLTKVEKDDLVQEVLHDLWRGYRSKFVPGMEGEVRALLSKIVNSKINDESRRWKTRKRSDHGEVSMHAGERSIDLSGAEKAPCKTAESSEFNELLKYNLSRLSEEHRRVLYLCIDRNLPLETVAHEMRITADAVSSMKRRALQALRRLMEDDGVTGSKID